MKALSLLTAFICLASSSFAEPIIINLRPGDKELPKGEEIKLPLEAAELSITIKNMLSDLEGSEEYPTAWKTDGEPHVVNVPITAPIDERTLRALANALTAMRNLQKRKIEITFRKLRTTVKDFSFPTSTKKTKDLLDLLLAANFLDVKDLLRPTAAAWVDQYQIENGKRPEIWLLGAEVPSELKSIPKELLPLFTDYWKWVHGQRIYPSANQVIRNKNDTQKRILWVADNKLYLSNEDSISIFDLMQNRTVARREIPLIPHWGAQLFDNKLYVLQGDSVQVLDVETLEPKGHIQLPPLPIEHLCFAGSKFYWIGREVIKVIDTATGKVESDIALPLANYRVSNAIAVGGKLYLSDKRKVFSINLITKVATEIKALEDKTHIIATPLFGLAGKKLYVNVGSSKEISVVDVATDKVIGSIEFFENPSALYGYGNILFVGKHGVIYIVDSATDQTVKNVIMYPSGKPRDMAFSGKTLYVTEDWDRLQYFSGIDLDLLEKFNAYYSK